MSNLTKIIAGVVVLTFVVGAVVLMNWSIPAPESKVTKTLNNDRFPG